MDLKYFFKLSFKSENNIPVFRHSGVPVFLLLLHALLMFDFHAGNISEYYSDFFTSVNRIHHYNTRLASRSSYSLPRVRTNYGKFNIRFNSGST